MIPRALPAHAQRDPSTMPSGLGAGLVEPAYLYLESSLKKTAIADRIECVMAAIERPSSGQAFAC